MDGGEQKINLKDLYEQKTLIFAMVNYNIRRNTNLNNKLCEAQ